MNTYKKLFGPTWLLTESAAEVPANVRAVIRDAAELDMNSEPFVAAAWTDGPFSRATGFVVVTAKMVITKQLTVVQQSYFQDITGVERSATGNIVLSAPGNRADAVAFSQMPKRELLDRLFAIINTRWRAAREAAHATPPPLPRPSVAHVDAPTATSKPAPAKLTPSRADAVAKAILVTFGAALAWSGLWSLFPVLGAVVNSIIAIAVVLFLASSRLRRRASAIFGRSDARSAPWGVAVPVFAIALMAVAVSVFVHMSATARAEAARTANAQRQQHFASLVTEARRLVTSPGSEARIASLLLEAESIAPLGKEDSANLVQAIAVGGDTDVAAGRRADGLAKYEAVLQRAPQRDDIKAKRDALQVEALVFIATESLTRTGACKKKGDTLQCTSQLTFAMADPIRRADKAARDAMGLQPENHAAQAIAGLTSALMPIVERLEREAAAREAKTRAAESRAREAGCARDAKRLETAWLQGWSSVLSKAETHGKPPSRVTLHATRLWFDLSYEEKGRIFSSANNAFRQHYETYHPEIMAAEGEIGIAIVDALGASEVHRTHP